MTKEELIAFEEDIVKEFEAAKIPYPIHLANGNEDILIDIFKGANIGSNDWVCCSWRSHYECLLKGVPPELLKQHIMDGYSIGMCLKDYRVVSSAIVGGICSIAVGIALGIQLQNSENARVFCFVGDMTAEAGNYLECRKYALYHDLPIEFIIADNGKSVCTDTVKTWNVPMFARQEDSPWNQRRYNYEGKFPHSGGLTRVNF
jgi:TPP-dependent pyruvate/acetoin dehydrogenase alpha subunit